MVLLKVCAAQGTQDAHGFGSVARFPSVCLLLAGRWVSGHPGSLPERLTCEGRGGRAPWPPTLAKQEAGTQYSAPGRELRIGAFGHCLLSSLTTWGRAWLYIHVYVEMNVVYLHMCSCVCVHICMYVSVSVYMFVHRVGQR